MVYGVVVGRVVRGVTPAAALLIVNDIVGVRGRRERKLQASAAFIEAAFSIYAQVRRRIGENE